MTFQRQPTDKWRKEVPGARWFKADLHVHTIDDYQGGRAKMPDGVAGSPADPDAQAQYVRLFLQAVVRSGVQVVGLTPHSARAGDGPETSATWRIVEEWNEGLDDDKVPFRDKIYAVFPGFEPSFNDGKEGLHLLLLFDPEIGRERYLKAFDLVMDGITPWQDGKLQISGKRADGAFDWLKEFRERERLDGEDWNSLVLAPHIDTSKGLLGAQKAQVLQRFDHGAVAGLELGDEKLPEETLRSRPWLREGMEAYRQAFFHASDAYRLDEIGWRHGWVKLANPRIEALRQAFIASDSRMRIAFEKGGNAGKIRPVSDPPEFASGKRPWLREVAIVGGTSFFGGQERGAPRETRFRLNPDLTCIIGGSMTGKSTLLDGLRLHIGAALPVNESVRGQVETRGREVFAAGSPQVTLDCPGQDRTAPPFERWPARFFAQNELQRLSQEGAAVEDILTRLIPSEIKEIDQRSAELERLDKYLADLAEGLAKLDEAVDEAEQACQRTGSAKKALATFSEAGVDRLHQASRERQAWESTASAVQTALCDPVGEAARAVQEISLPPAGGERAEDPIDWRKLDLDGRQRRLIERLEASAREAEKWIADILGVSLKMGEREAAIRVEVERALAARGYDAGTLKEIQQLTRQASLFPSYETHRDNTNRQLLAGERAFNDMAGKRSAVVEAQRRAFERVAQGVEWEFGGKIRVSRVDNADVRPLGEFLRGLGQRGITRWWNDLGASKRPSPDRLVACLDAGSLGEIDMSDAVQNRFRECITESKRRELAALRCPDRYAIELRMDDDSYRSLNDLSGGQRVSVLLSLLLETEDSRPLVIDQPEDELDNRFLSETVLPALKKMRGRRQVIVATHKAEIVVNGDPDLVIQLDATARQGRVACAGAIEEPAVRDAIVRTVDGGEEAFRLRRRKYGF